MIENYFGRNSFAGTNAERLVFTPLMDYAYFYETDTEDFYIWSGAAWHGAIGGGGGGPFVCTGVVDTITVTHIFQARIDLNDGDDNVFITGGNDTLTGTGNTVVGEDALTAVTSGNNNVAIGFESLFSNTEGEENVAIGWEAMYFNTTGVYNVALGTYALGTNTTGEDNVAIGMSALSSNKDGDMNVGIGDTALNDNEYGVENTAIGLSALNSVNPFSDEITAFADYSGTVAGTVKVTSPGHGLPAGATTNVCIYNTTNYNQGPPGITVTQIDANNFYFTHAWAGDDGPGGYWRINQTGDFNTSVGAESGNGITRGSWNTFLGFQAGSDGAQVADIDESVAIGYLSFTTKDKQVVLGNPGRTEETQLCGLTGVNLGTTEPTPAAQLDVLQDEAAGAIPVLELDQDDVDESFINYVGTSAADQTKSISTVNGDGSVTGPKNFSATAGWEFVGMVKIEVNGAEYWMPYYQPDTA